MHLLLLILHTALLVRLLADQPSLLRLTELDLLVLLGEIARHAAAGTEAVLAAVALQLVGGTDVATLKHGHDPAEAAVGKSSETDAGAVTTGIAVKVVVLQAMVCASVCDAGTAPGKKAGVEWRAAITAADFPVAFRHVDVDWLRKFDSW